ncbi:MAG: AAA family ATPase [Deltaproteobacteria bacterium]|nr:AAA family ATPase [Deltaproteobacteria bacterium]
MNPGDVVLRLQQAARVLEEHFLGKQEIIRLMLVTVVAGEHMAIVGPPGTAKSALVRLFARLVDARYFEYLLTRFTEPNEIFGPIDIAAFREGVYRRRMEGMLPEAEVVFLDEVFKANSAILNSLLTLLNERVYTSGRSVIKTPLISAFGASNEVPNDESLMAIFDRFLLRVRSEYLDSYHFHELLLRGIKNEVRQIRGDDVRPILSAADLTILQRQFADRLSFTEEFLSAYKGLVFQIRAEGVSLSDRRAVKLLKLFAASALVDGRPTPDASDFFLIKHVWNNLDQVEILEAIVGPVLEEHYRQNPQARRFGAADVGLDGLNSEINRIRDVLASGRAISDVQLFSQLKSLNEIKAALQAMGTPGARDALSRVDQLLGHVFASGRFTQ